MAFQHFSFPQVVRDLGLTVASADLYHAIPPATLRPDFLENLADEAGFAGILHTEKARSEFIIAPVLWELRRRHPGKFGLFSGVELDADSTRGLNGVCDFLLTRSPQQYLIEGPLLSIVEVKNDNTKNGLGQCIASMVAAQVVNQARGESAGNVIYGVVTTGTLWKFLRLSDTTVTIDEVEYAINDAAKIMGILDDIVAP